ncbi:MAG: hypothetical protein K2K17_04320, partial [Lachnospiraceae bacterium]|nr:hypothetical protein [Lachnospiraceae bacterium]
GTVVFMKNSGEEEASNGGTRDGAQEQTAGSGTGDNAQGQTADEALESLNAEINAMIEAEQREEEEREQQLEEGYPEGVIPPAGYICRDLLDEESDIYIDRYMLSSFDSGKGDFWYIYDEDTKIYTIFTPDDKYVHAGGSYVGKYWFHLEGYLNDEGDFVVTYYARYDRDILRETVGTITGEIAYDRFEAEHPEVADIVLDDIEWIYVIYE